MASGPAGWLRPIPHGSDAERLRRKAVQPAVEVPRIPTIRGHQSNGFPADGPSCSCVAQIRVSLCKAKERPDALTLGECLPQEAIENVSGLLRPTKPPEDVGLVGSGVRR